MQDISAGGGRTVLFVSHNMASVKSLCTRAIILENGRKTYQGGTDESINVYLRMGNEKGSTHLRYFDKNEFKDKDFEIHSVGVKAKNKDYGKPIVRNDEINVHIAFFKPKGSSLKSIGIRLKDEQGNFVFVSDYKFDHNETSKYKSVMLIIRITFLTKMYFLLM